MKRLIAILTLNLIAALYVNMTPIVDYTKGGEWIICYVNLIKETDNKITFFSQYVMGKVQYTETDYNMYETYTVDFTKSYQVLKLDMALNDPIVKYIDKQYCQFYKKKVAN